MERLPSVSTDPDAELDLRLGWSCGDLGISLVGRNLLDDHHPEFVDFYTDVQPTETQRGVYGAVTWQF